MHRPDILNFTGNHSTSLGFTHFSISVGGKQKVNELTEQFRSDGYKIIEEPRTTSDGCDECVIEDCEGNCIEITK